MSINPDNITTIRVDQLAEATLNLTNEFPHSEDATLRKATIQSLVDLVATAVGSGSGVGFLPISVTDGQQLPNVPADPSFFLCGVGTFLNINGYPNIVCTEELNAIMSVSDHWQVAVEIPINVDLQSIGISQSVNNGVLDKAPSENAVYNFISQWLPKSSLGYFDYADLATQTTPITVAPDTETLLTNDTLGDDTNTSQPPYGVTAIWDADSDEFNFQQLSVGDTVDIRIHLKTTTTTANQKYHIDMKFAFDGSDEFENRIFSQYVKTAGEDEQTFITSFYIGSESVKNYPAKIYITSDDDATVKVVGWFCRVFRKSVNIVDIITDEAPIDGLTYGRKDAEWVEVSGGGSVGTLQQVLTQGYNVADIGLAISFESLDQNTILDKIGLLAFSLSNGSSILYSGIAIRYIKNDFSTNLRFRIPTTDNIIYIKDGNGDLAFESDIPTELSELNDDATHRLVTDTQISTWDGKQNTLTETNFGSFINGLTAKNTLVDADEVVSDDSADSNKAKKTSWLNVWLNYLKPKADALYAPLASVSTMVKLPADVTSTITTETVISSFTYAVSANTTYVIRGRLALGCNGTGGVNLGTKFPSGAVLSGTAFGRTSSQTSFISTTFSTSGALSGGLNSINSQGGFAFVEIVLSVGSTAGNFNFIFSSVTSGQTSTVIAAGSYLEYIKL